jgi:hypothetical protein
MYICQKKEGEKEKESNDLLSIDEKIGSLWCRAWYDHARSVVDSMDKLNNEINDN